jgi:pyruvate/2-oxoglutarate dehydrogenase complex dihydrolipoamide acyltransferase (E2) component
MRVITAGDVATEFGKADVTHWYAKVGDLVSADGDLVEFADSKNVFVIKAPVTMRLVRILAPKGSPVVAATVLCEGEDA